MVGGEGDTFGSESARRRVVWSANSHDGLNPGTCSPGQCHRRDIFLPRRDRLFFANARPRGGHGNAIEEQVHIRLLPRRSATSAATVKTSWRPWRLDAGATGRAASTTSPRVHSARPRRRLPRAQRPTWPPRTEGNHRRRNHRLVRGRHCRCRRSTTLIDRRIAGGHRALAPPPKISAAGQQTILRGGCIAKAGGGGGWPTRARSPSRSPLSDRDARDVDALIALFARETRAIVGESDLRSGRRPVARPSPAAGKPAAIREGSAPEPGQPGRRRDATKRRRRGSWLLSSARSARVVAREEDGGRERQRRSRSPSAKTAMKKTPAARRPPPARLQRDARSER
jgi:hypothetical protein